jgi:hypothetical protein
MKIFIKFLIAAGLFTVLGVALSNATLDAHGETKEKTAKGLFTISSADGACLISFDGTTSSQSPAGPTPTLWRSQCCGNGVCVRVERSGLIRTFTSGANWISENRPPSALHGVAFGNGCYVAVGNEGLILTAGPEMIWKERKSGTDDRLRGITFGNGVFVAVGYEGTILTSKFGTNWKRRRSGTVQRLQGIAFGNGTFVAVGWHGTILTSCDGFRWREARSGTTNRLERVVFRSSVEAAAANNREPDVPSVDGVIWDRRLVPEQPYYEFVAIGENEIIAGNPGKFPLRRSQFARLERAVSYPNGALVEEIGIAPLLTGEFFRVVW